MAKSAGQKLKLLYIIRFLEQNSDEAHPVSTAQLIEMLDKEGIHSERKSIYDDIASLQEFGYDIIHLASRNGGGYYLASRDFELPELKLLVDAVQASRFITTKKSRELIGKLEKKAGRFEAGQLQRQVYVAGRVKTENESIYYNIDTIHRGIQDDRKISFSYLDWNVEKKLVPRDSTQRTVSPWALIWQDENYYLAAFDSDSGIIKHYRVDKMGRVAVTDRKREGKEAFQKLDLASYSNATFGMFGGKEEVVTIVFPRRLIGVALDRFGREADVRVLDDETFRIRAKVVVSGQFFGWLSGIGGDVKIAAPQDVKDQYRQWIARILDGMNSETGSQ